MAEINCCLGCPHDCRYCYARTAALKQGLIDSAADWSQMRIMDNLVAEERPCYPGQVMFPTAHDIVEENLEVSTQVIDRLLAAGNRVLIVSKPAVACIERICDRFHGQRHNILFRFTITAREQSLLSFWEPGAPAYEDRLESLKLAYNRGFETSVSIEPIIAIKDLAGLIEEVQPLVSHSIWLGKMNRIDERVTIDSEEMAAEIARIKSEQDDKQIIELYESQKDNPLIRWKESIKEVVGLPLHTVLGLDL